MEACSPPTINPTLALDPHWTPVGSHLPLLALVEGVLNSVGESLTNGGSVGGLVGLVRLGGTRLGGEVGTGVCGSKVPISLQFSSQKPQFPLPPT